MAQKGSYCEEPVNVLLFELGYGKGCLQDNCNFGKTYNWYNFVLDLRSERYQLEEAGEVELHSKVSGRYLARYSRRTEDTRSPKEIVCWARVMTVFL